MTRFANSPRFVGPVYGRAAAARFPRAEVGAGYISGRRLVLGFPRATSLKLRASQPGGLTLSKVEGQTIPNSQSAELQTPLNHRKQRTENFLIANFGAIPDLQSCSKTSLCFLRTPSVQSRTSSSNRHTPRLEMLVSHRKQTTGPRSNRHKIAFCEPSAITLPALPVPSLPAEAGAAEGNEAQERVAEGSSALASMERSGSCLCYRLSTINCKLPSLIENDMHSREASCCCKKKHLLNSNRK
jgi:hypothetical protein